MDQQEVVVTEEIEPSKHQYPFPYPAPREFTLLDFTRQQLTMKPPKRTLAGTPRYVPTLDEIAEKNRLGREAMKRFRAKHPDYDKDRRKIKKENKNKAHKKGRKITI